MHLLTFPLPISVRWQLNFFMKSMCRFSKLPQQTPTTSLTWRKRPKKVKLAEADSLLKWKISRDFQKLMFLRWIKCHKKLSKLCEYKKSSSSKENWITVASHVHLKSVILEKATSKISWFWLARELREWNLQILTWTFWIFILAVSFCRCLHI